MMKTKIQYFTYTLLMGALTACGGGGGGSSSPSQPTITASNTTQIPQTIISTHYPDYNNKGITTAVANDKTLYSITHSWKVQPPKSEWLNELANVVTETNKLRAAAGLSALKYDARLSAYAQRRAEEIVRLYEHQRLNGQEVWEGLSNGYRGENLDVSKSTAAETVARWKNSAGHYENIVSSNFTKIGVGLVYLPNSQYGYYWVQIFGDDDTTSNYYFDTNIAETDNTQPLTSLLVDGVSIPLVAPNGQWQTLNANSYQGTYNGYANTRFGMLKNQAVDGGSYQTFYQGTPTQDMPQTGSAQYAGTAVWSNGNSVNNQLNAKFDVNFQNKSLTGSISDNANQTVPLKADITGNTFHSAIGADVETHGGFFGNNAAELAGDFREQKQGGKTGAFGATKQ